MTADTRRPIACPRGTFAKRFDSWIRTQGFGRMRDVAIAVGYTYDACVKWRRGDRTPGIRARRELDAFMSGKQPLLTAADHADEDE